MKALSVWCCSRDRQTDKAGFPQSGQQVVLLTFGITLHSAVLGSRVSFGYNLLVLHCSRFVVSSFLKYTLSAMTLSGPSLALMQHRLVTRLWFGRWAVFYLFLGYVCSPGSSLAADGLLGYFRALFRHRQSASWL